jgi:hypothetical protein
VQRKVIWDETRSKAAGLLALGYPKTHVASEVGVTRNTIYAWLDDPEFAEEVDRLSLMTGVANRAERLRVAMRVIRSRLNEDGIPQSEKDVLEWLKFAQSETHGARLDFGKLAELLTGESSQQADGPATRQLQGEVIDTTAISTSTDSGESGDSSSLSQDVVAGSDEELNPS